MINKRLSEVIFVKGKVIIMSSEARGPIDAFNAKNVTITPIATRRTLAELNEAAVPSKKN